MPRIRTIKPEMAADRKFASISREARYTFVLLITQSDDDGLILGSPRQLLGQLYPHDDTVDLARLSRELRECLDIGLIRWRETVDGAPVVEICNWAKHQRIDHRGKSLVLPNLSPLSRDSRETVATPSRDPRAPTLDLGPTTHDQGPLATSRKKRAPRPKGEGVPNWLAPIGAAWEARYDKGSFPYGQAAGLLKPLTDAGHSPDEIARRLAWYLENKGSEAVLNPADLARRHFAPSLKDFRQRFGKFDPSEEVPV